MIALEVAMNKRNENRQAYANQVKDFTRPNFDIYHNRTDSPQKNHFRYQNSDYRRSMPPNDGQKRLVGSGLERTDVADRRVSYFQRYSTDKNPRVGTGRVRRQSRSQSTSSFNSYKKSPHS